MPQDLATASTQIDAHTGNRAPVTSMEGLYDATTLCVLRNGSGQKVIFLFSCAFPPIFSHRRPSLLSALRGLLVYAISQVCSVQTQAPTTFEFERGALGFQNRPMVVEISHFRGTFAACCLTHNPLIFGLGDFVKAQNGKERALGSLKSPPGNAILQNKKAVNSVRVGLIQ